MEEAVLNTYVEGAVEIAVAAPSDWEQLDGVMGLLVAFVAPAEREEGFRPNFNIVLQSVEGPGAAVAPEQFNEAHAAELGEALEQARIVDASLTTVGGLPASRALILYCQNAFDLTLEQWIIRLPGRNLVLSATCENIDYAALAPVFDETVQSLSLTNA